MRFKLKALVAALALAAVAGQASAALTAPTTTTGKSDLLFYAIDVTNNRSFVYDLGAASSLASLTTPVNVTGSSAWSSFFAAEGSSTSNFTWGLAYDQGSNANSSVWGTTVTIGSSLPSVALTTTALSNGRQSFNSFLQATAISAAGGSEYAPVAGNNNYVTNLANNWANPGLLTVDNAVGIGNLASFYSFDRTVVGGTLLQSNLYFDGTNVGVAAVPEPETYGMLAAGLLMLGAVARRRKA